jgi:hypothetical protein
MGALGAHNSQVSIGGARESAFRRYQKQLHNQSVSSSSAIKPSSRSVSKKKEQHPYIRSDKKRGGPTKGDTL